MHDTPRPALYNSCHLPDPARMPDGPRHHRAGGLLLPGDTVRAPQPCRDCHTPTHSTRCPTCTSKTRARADRRRPTATQRGYTGAHTTFRRLVLARDPWCTCPGCPSCEAATCLRDSTDADHHPTPRSLLVATGQDPNDPKHGRGLCHPCHSHKSATQGGFGR